MRPKELTAELLKAAREYADGGYQQNGEILPTISGLALFVGKSKTSLYRYAEENEDMADIMERVNTRQEVLLINGGLRSDYNAAIARLMLANHGYSDKQAIDHTSNGKAFNTQMPTTIELVVPDFDDWSEPAKENYRQSQESKA